MFQSAPLTDVRGDMHDDSFQRLMEGFNPLPSRM